MGGGEALTHDRLNLLTNLTGGIVPSIEVKNEENVSGKKTGAKRGPKPKPKLKPEDEDEEPEDTNDPNRPKKAITAYIRYCQDQRAIIAERLGANAPTGKVGETLTEAWNTLPEEEKQVGHILAYLYLKCFCIDSQHRCTEMLITGIGS